MKYQLCLSEPAVIRTDHITFTSVSGKPTTMMATTWYSYVVLPNPLQSTR